MVNPATPDDLAARWHPNPLADPAAYSVAATRLDEAWRALRSEVRTIQADIDSGAVDVDVVVDVLASAALRVLRNPEGYSSVTGSIDDYTESWKLDLAATSSDLYFTRAELRRVSPAASRGAFTITPGG